MTNVCTATATALVQPPIDAGFEKVGEVELVDGHVCRQDLAMEAVVALDWNDGWMDGKIVNNVGI